MKHVWKEYKKALFEIVPLENKKVWTNLETSKATLEANTYNSRYVLKSREAEIFNEKISIYNNIIYPKTGANLPCFGMDLMMFFEKKVIITFDFQHPEPEFLFKTKLLPQTNIDVRFFESGNHFSSHVYVVKCTVDEIPDHLDSFKDYLRVYSHLLYSSEPSGIEESIYSEFDQYMRDLDPVAGYLKSYFGQENSENLVNNFLFTY